MALKTVPIFSKIWNLSFKKFLIKVYETAPREKRWKLGTLTGITLTSGIFMAYILGMGDSNDPKNPIYWRFVALFPIAINIIQLVMMSFFLFESPKFYVISKGLTEKAI